MKSQITLRLADYRKAWNWFAKVMGLRDWTLILTVSDKAPDWVKDEDCFGMCDANHPFKLAKIWINPSLNKKKKADPLITFFHEGMHVASTQADIEGLAPACEFMWNRLAHVFAAAYRHGWTLKREDILK
jgi:hypothetical protein